MPPDHTRVALVDDHEMFVDILSQRLAQEPDIEVVASASSGAEALATIPADVDVVLCDHHLPDTDGVTLTERLLAAIPSANVLMVTSSRDDTVLIRAISAGCCGFIPKTAPLDDVTAAIRVASAGESVITPDELAVVLTRVAERSESADPLTPREHDVLEQMARGRSNQDIAATLYVAVDTTRNHVSSILRKLDSHSKLEAVVTAARRGLIDLGPQV